MSGAVSFDTLLGIALEPGDSFVAAALYPYAGADQRVALEDVLFANVRLKRQFASAPYTPASVLDRLASDRDRRLRARVAKHPATRADTLMRLAQEEDFPECWSRVARHPNAPKELLQTLFKRERSRREPEIRRALCENQHTPQTVLEQLAPDASLAELKYMVANPNADSELLRACWQRDDQYLQAAVAAHINCPPDLLRSAEQSMHTLVRRKLAQNPAVTDSVLMRLLCDLEAAVRAAAVRHLVEPKTAVRDWWHSDPSRQVRRNQARHTRLPAAWVKHLAVDSDHWVRRLIARNPATPEVLLRALAKDAEMQVRRAVARNPACPARLLQQLGQDQHAWVRAGVALRADIPPSLLEQLAGSDDIDVLSAVGTNLNSPTAILQRIAGHADRDVRRAVILNSGATSAVLQHLLADPYPLNRVLLCTHASLVAEQLNQLLHDPEPEVRFAAAQALVRRLSGDRRQ